MLSKNIVHLFFSLIFLIGMSSCGQKDRLPPNDQSKSTRDYLTLNEVQNAFEYSDVTCGEANGECPSNIAKISFWYPHKQGYQLSVCSGTLIDEEYILTNSHCIPDHLQSSGADCSQNIKISFPDTKYFYDETLNCITVVQAFPLNDKNPDLAVLKVTKSRYKRKSTIVKKNKITHHEAVYAYTMNPPEDHGLIGTIVRKECTISLDNFLTDTTINTVPDSFLLFGQECNVIGGNSGSGLFNSQDELIGAINIKIELEILTSLFKEMGLPHDTFTYMGGAVNIGCLNTLYQSSGIGCEIPKQQEVDKVSILDFLNQKRKEQDLDDVRYKNICFKYNKQTELILTEDHSCPLSQNLNFLSTKLRSIESEDFVKAKVILK